MPRPITLFTGQWADLPLAKLAPLAKSVGAQYGVPGLKAALDLCGYTGGLPRPPLQPVPKSAIDQIREQLASLNLLEASHAAR